MKTKQSPIIGVFDSGFGGLTVLRALLSRFPEARFIYVGDTARLPYGAKSQQTIARYALSAAAFLLAQGVEMLVVACNTASALALDDLKAALPIPVVGVIEPGTQAAAAAASQASQDSTATQVLVLATAATVQSAAYARSCAALGVRAYEKACPLLVPLIEEGWIEHPVTAEVARIYLEEALLEAPSVTTLVLGCTHYPLIRPLLERTLAALGHPLQIVDSASATAEAAAQAFPILEETASTLTAPARTPAPAPVPVPAPAPAVHAQPTSPTSPLPPLSSFAAGGGSAFALQTTPHCTFYATDSIEKFRRLGSAFLGQPLPEVHLLDMGG